MSQFYTRTGDDGFTGQLGAGRISKDHPRTEAVGAIDEANAAIGWARASCQTEVAKEMLLVTQRHLYQVMAEVSATPENASRFRTIGSEQVTWLEDQIAMISTQIEIPNEFIVPGDTLPGAALDLARAIVRRAERRVSQLWHQAAIENTELLRYMNRLSSLCFILELLENQASGHHNPTLAKTQP